VSGAEEFDRFYRDTSRRLMRYAYGLSGDAAESQDLVQEAYARAWQRWAAVSRYDDPEAWLRLVLTRLVTDWWRRRAVRRAAADAARPVSPAGPPGDDTILLVRALRELPLAQRRALVLHYLLDRSVTDIAAETGAAEGTVKSWLSRGRAALAARIGTDGAGVRGTADRTVVPGVRDAT
jgi:RNA polymerase sigma-70 factor (ECF subfamily)